MDFPIRFINFPILILLIFILLAVSVYACDINFCSSIVCVSDKACIDTCSGSYLYSQGKCADCFSHDSKHCKYQSKTCDKKCGAECTQCSDCSCPQSGCVGQDFYEYKPNCNDSCMCECNAVVTANDSRCLVCNESSVDCSNPACTSNVQCLPCDTNNVNCSIPSCSSNPKCAPCDISNVDCNVLACANNTQCLPCDNTNVDCSNPACASNPSCAKPSPSIGGGTIISGGYIPPITAAFCGDNVCSHNETCSSCPKDCLKQGEVCCDNVAYSGNCCTDLDCGSGYECNISKMCQPIPTKPACVEDWVCGNWSECLNGVASMRKCVDKNNCGSIEDRPDLVQRCTLSNPTGLSLLTVPVLGLIASAFVILFLILFFWRRRKKGSLNSPDNLVTEIS